VPSDADLAALDCTVAARSAVILWFAGTPVLVIGTSSSSPEMAGVLALAVELNGGRLGNVNPLIYSLSAVQTLAGGTGRPKRSSTSIAIFRKQQRLLGEAGPGVQRSARQQHVGSEELSAAAAGSPGGRTQHASNP